MKPNPADVTRVKRVYQRLFDLIKAADVNVHVLDVEASPQYKAFMEYVRAELTDQYKRLATKEHVINAIENPNYTAAVFKSAWDPDLIFAFYKWLAACGIQAGREKVDALMKSLGGDLFDVTDQELLNQLSDRTGYIIDSVDETTKENIARIIEQGTENGDAVGKIVQALMVAIPVIAERRAEMIALTETAWAMSKAENEFYARNGITEWAWHTSRDERVCSVCNGRAGQIKGLGVELPPAHPRCRCFMDPILPTDFDGYNWTGTTEYPEPTPASRPGGPKAKPKAKPEPLAPDIPEPPKPKPTPPKPKPKPEPPKHEPLAAGDLPKGVLDRFEGHEKTWHKNGCPSNGILFVDKNGEVQFAGTLQHGNYNYFHPENMKNAGIKRKKSEYVDIFRMGKGKDEGAFTGMADRTWNAAGQGNVKVVRIRTEQNIYHVSKTNGDVFDLDDKYRLSGGDYMVKQRNLVNSKYYEQKGAIERETGKRLTATEQHRLFVKVDFEAAQEIAEKKWPGMYKMDRYDAPKLKRGEAVGRRRADGLTKDTFKPVYHDKTSKFLTPKGEKALQDIENEWGKNATPCEWGCISDKDGNLFDVDGYVGKQKGQKVKIKQGRATSVSWTFEDTIHLKHNIVTHYHPDSILKNTDWAGDGGPLSTWGRNGGDIKNCFTFDMAGKRARTAKYLYSLDPPDQYFSRTRITKLSDIHDPAFIKWLEDNSVEVGVRGRTELHDYELLYQMTNYADEMAAKATRYEHGLTSHEHYWDVMFVTTQRLFRDAGYSYTRFRVLDLEV